MRAINIKPILTESYRRWLHPELQDAIDRMRVLPHWRRRGVGFLHIPKNAGVSITMALYGRKLPHVKASTLLGHHSTPTFAIVRDPIDRFLSAFRFATAGGSEFGRPNSATLAAARRFPSHTEFLHNWLAQAPYTSRDVIFHRQSDYVCDESGNVLVDRLFPIERLGELTDFLSALGVQEAEVGHLNATERSRDIRLSGQDLLRLREWYAADFRLVEQAWRCLN